MGWNSWDAYGLTIDEPAFKSNVQVLAGMRQYGWQYAVIDEGWYMRNPFGKDLAERNYLYDANGLLEPDEARFPSAAGKAGFKPLADYVHAQGFKFGIHIVRGIPKQVVKENLPIAGSSFHAADAADTTATCPWDDANFGVADNAAGQAYYDSMLKKYAEWGLDFIKVDCISDHPYRPSEIRQIALAIRKTGRPIVLSLSPGPTNLSYAAEVARYSQMWRIADDHWDVWADSAKTGDFPFGLSEEFDRIASWNRYVKPGNWPDPDMLPEGSLTPNPGWGKSRNSRYTPDEQRTEFLLWSIARAPLFWGGNLTRLDDYSRSLMTNGELLSVNQKARESHPVSVTLPGFDHIRVWKAAVGNGAKDAEYIALFNLGDAPASLQFTWEQLTAARGHKQARDLISGAQQDATKAQSVTLPAHGSAIFGLQ